MKRFALVRGGGIVNVIVADDAFIAAHGAEQAEAQGGGEWVELTEARNVKGQRPGPGWLYSGGKFSPPRGGA